MWLGLTAIVLVFALVLLYFTGLLGPSQVRPLNRAAHDVRRVLEAGRQEDSLGPLADLIGAETPSSQKPASGEQSHVSSATSGREPRLAPRSSAADFAVPAGLAFGVGLESWLTPDAAAVAALDQVSGEAITSALDLHTTVAAHEYKLWTEGSMMNWRGHVGEQQIAEQITAWDVDAIAMPDASNFAGADLEIFGEGYQVKFVQDFNDINNTYGDPLIVPEDTLNIPEDALVVDFSVPIDASVLEGHDVIVAEGLTLAGAEDAWESAVGLAAGGYDFGDIGDTFGDFAIPGFGSAVRVAASGYRRREALADPVLRHRATGRVARDVAYTSAGVASGGTIGALIGGAVDVLSLGMTMGLGSMIGGAIGAGMGGRTAGQLAAAEDQARIDARVQEVRSAIGNYGLEVKRVEKKATARWAESQRRVDEHAAEAARTRSALVTHSLARARKEIRSLSSISAAESAALLDQASDQVASCSDTSPRAKRLQRSWTLRAGREREAIEPDPSVILTLVAASPGGLSAVEDWALERSHERDRLLAAAHRVSGTYVVGALADRVRFSQELASSKAEIQLWSKTKLDAAAKPVASANGDLSRELKLAGR